MILVAKLRRVAGERIAAHSFGQEGLYRLGDRNPRRPRRTCQKSLAFVEKPRSRNAILAFPASLCATFVGVPNGSIPVSGKAVTHGDR